MNGQEIFLAEAKPWIIIAGFANSKKHIPFTDERWSIWGMNDLYHHLPRIDVSFELHHTMNMGGRRNPEHEAVLRGGGRRGSGFPTGRPATPIFMQQAHPEYPTVIPFPADTIIAAFGKRNLPPLEYESSVTPGASYFTNSVSWMIALAIGELTEEREINGRMMRVAKPDARLGIYGISMAADCVAPDTRVLTEKLRWVPASEVKVGDKLMAFDEYPEDKGVGNKYRRWRVATVEQAQEVMKPCYQLLLEDGTKMTASSNHKWLVDLVNDHTWRTTEQLRDLGSATSSRSASRLTKVLEPWDELHSRDAGYLAAAFDGEGHLNQQQHSHCETHSFRLSYAQRQNEMSRAVTEALGKYGFEYAIGTPKTSDCLSYNLKGGRPELLRFLGQVRPGRLLAKFNPHILGRFERKEHVAIVEKHFVGDRPVIALKTDTGTFLAEGFASHNSEYIAQKPSVEYWIGRAQGYGIDVTIPEDAHILKTATLYGYASSSDLRIRLQSDREDMSKRTIELQQTLAQKQAEAAQAEAELHAVRGQKSYVDMLVRNMTIGTEIGIGSDEQGPKVGRDSILTLVDGEVVESIVVPSDGQPQLQEVNSG